MLFYIKCPSCSRVISGNIDEYYEKIEAIKDDPKMTKAQKEEAMSKLLDKYESICCKIRIMGLVPYHKIIQT